MLLLGNIAQKSFNFKIIISSTATAPLGHLSARISIIPVTPLSDDFSIIIRLVSKSHVAGTIKEFPTAVLDTVVHGFCQQRSALIVSAADHQAGLGDLTQTGRIVKIFQIAPRRVLVGSPRHLIALRAKAFLPTQALRAVGGDAAGMKFGIVVIGRQVVLRLKVLGRFSFPDSSLVLR